MATSPKKKNQLLTFLRPLIAFGVVLLAALGYFQHQRMMERTRINFTVQPPDQNASLLASAWLDGKAASSGQKITLGSHTFKVTHPHGETFETNFTAWYGGKDFGVIALKRSTGTLNIHAKRPILVLSVSGRDFNTVITNVTEKSLIVPTDEYTVMAMFPNRPGDTQKISVTAGLAAECSFAPPYGTLRASANREGATYELIGEDGTTLIAGSLPRSNDAIPVGTYRLVAKWHSLSTEKQIEVKKDETCDAVMDFSYGAAIVKTSPSGATVLSANGTQLGTTPLLVTEISPGQVEYRLKLDGYEDASVALSVAANATNEVSTNLMSLAYLGGMQKARNYMSAAEYHGALDGVNQALEAKPGDPDATALLTTIKCRAAVLDAKNLASQGDFAGAGQKLQAALQAKPDDTEAQTLLAEYKTHASEQVATTQENTARDLFEQDWKKVPCGQYFEAHEYLTGRMTPEQARDALVKSFTEQWPKAVVKINRTLQDGVYEVMFEQSGSDTPARREMLMMFTKGKDGQTLILFKNFEYQRTDAGNYTPLNLNFIQMTPAYEEQIKVGVRMMMRKIRVAIGETDKY